MTPPIKKIDINQKKPCPFCGEAEYEIEIEWFEDEITDIQLFCSCGWSCLGYESSSNFISYSVE